MIALELYAIEDTRRLDVGCEFREVVPVSSEQTVVFMQGCNGGHDVQIVTGCSAR